MQVYNSLKMAAQVVWEVKKEYDILAFISCGVVYKKSGCHVAAVQPLELGCFFPTTALDCIVLLRPD